MRWIAVLSLIAACAGPVAARGQPTRSVPQETAAAESALQKLVIRVSPQSTEIEFSVTMRDSNSAVGPLVNDWHGEALCGRLSGIRIQARPACDWLAGPDRRTRSHSVEVRSGQVRVSIRRRLETAEFAERGPFVAIDLDSGTLPALLVQLEARHPLFVANARPLPIYQNRQAVLYRIDPSGVAEDRRHILVGLDAPLDAGTRESLPRRGPPSFAESLRSEELSRMGMAARSLLSDVGRTSALLLPILLAYGIVKTNRRDRRLADDYGPLRRYCIAIGILAAFGILGRHEIPFFSAFYDWLNTLRPNAGIVDDGQDLWRSMINMGLYDLGQMALQAGGALLAALALALAFAIGARLLSRAGWRSALPSGAVLTRAFLIALVSLILVNLLNLFERLSDDYPFVPFEVYAVVVLLPLAPVILRAFKASKALLFSDRGEIGFILAFAIALVLLFPWRPSIYTLSYGSRPSGVDSSSGVLAVSGFYIATIASMASLLVLMRLLWRWGQRPTARDHPFGRRIMVGGLVFGMALAVQPASWLGIAAFVLASMIIWPRVALAPRAWLAQRLPRRTEEKTQLSKWVHALERAADLRAAARGSALNAKLGSGEMTPAQWSTHRKALEKARDNAIGAVHLDNKVAVRDLVLGFSPYPDPWTSGKQALLRGLPVMLLLGVLNLSQLSAPRDMSQPALFWVANVAQPFVQMAGLAFLFGYFFDRLRGGTGLHKALYLGAALSLAEVIFWLPQLSDPRALAGMVWTFSQHFLLLIPIGVAGFDYERMRAIERQRFDWRRFTWFGDPRLLSTGLAASAAALLPMIATLFSESFASAVRDIVTVVAPALPAS